MTLTLEEIIVKGLDEKLRETNYRSKIFATDVATPMQTDELKEAATFSVPESKVDEKSRHKSQDSSNSPGDSDYESAQVIFSANFKQSEIINIAGHICTKHDEV